MTLRNAVIEKGQLVLDDPLELADGTRVKVQIESEEDDPLLFLAEHALATGISDLAEQHDRYTYGTPGRQE